MPNNEFFIREFELDDTGRLVVQGQIVSLSVGLDFAQYGNKAGGWIRWQGELPCSLTLAQEQQGEIIPALYGALADRLAEGVLGVYHQLFVVDAAEESEVEGDTQIL